MAALALLAACGKQEAADAARQAEQLAAAAKARAEADARAAEAAAQDAAREAEGFAIGTEAYVYAYPLVTMEMTRRVMTNVSRPEGSRAPMGQFARMREYPDTQFREVTAPNADTLYTTAWFDVSQEPWIVSVPDMKGRYFLLPLLDGWTNVFQAPGKRVTGSKAQTFAITGPGWSGELPKGVTEYKSPTGLVWLLGRIYSSGTPADYMEVHALQDRITAVPLSSWGQPYLPEPAQLDPAIDTKAAVRSQVDALDAAAYFELFADLLKTNPPAAEDAPMLARLAKIGIVPGQDFDASKLEPALARGLAKVPKPAQQQIMAWLKEGVAAGDFKLENGWAYTTRAGVYGTRYLQRALIAAIGLGANRPQDAVYPTSTGPDLVHKYSGDKKYVMHFPKGQLPPVDGFWSLTMYDRDYFFVDNPLNRYTLSARNPLKANADGSVDLYIQADSPGADKESNWLPAPRDEFILMLRLYWPKQKPPSLLDGSWKIPQVEEAP
ncbi:MAG TPA: DUF1254 domain-containing protein [Rubrivivax sp.]|nr:DUF1254 domain-containing protein [Rubrivivax sp.]